MSPSVSRRVALALFCCGRSATAEPASDAAKSPQVRDENVPCPRVESALSLRLSQVYLSEGAKLGSAFLTGFGVLLSFRCKTSPWIGFDAWLDLYSGHDKYDSRRAEANVGIGLRGYLNPQDAVRLYGHLGGGWTLVDLSERWAQKGTLYRDAQLGLGLEFRLTHLSFNVNAVGFVRSQPSGPAPAEDEDDPREHAPDQSHGVILRVGTMFHF